MLIDFSRILVNSNRLSISKRSTLFTFYLRYSLFAVFACMLDVLMSNVPQPKAVFDARDIKRANVADTETNTSFVMVCMLCRWNDGAIQRCQNYADCSTIVGYHHARAAMLRASAAAQFSISAVIIAFRVLLQLYFSLPDTLM